MIDYLETRPDVDSDRFAYYGHSWGGRYDTDFLFETAMMPFFNGLATEPADKRHVIEPTGYFVSPLTITWGPRNSLISCSEQTGTQWATNCW